MTSITNTVKHAIANITETAKVKDLSRNIVEPSSSSGLTTDHGVAIPDTDNW